jgi:predicted metal-binding protein
MDKDVVVCSGCGRVWDNISGVEESSGNVVLTTVIRRAMIYNRDMVAEFSRSNIICANCRCEIIFPASVLNESAS